jgi:hypothetical protein
LSNRCTYDCKWFEIKRIKWLKTIFLFGIIKGRIERDCDAREDYDRKRRWRTGKF